MTAKEKKSEVWFDIEIYLYYSEHSNMEDDVITVGTYMVDKNCLKAISGSDICDYILEHQKDFFNMSNISNVTKNYMFRSIRCPHISYIYKSNSKDIHAYMFVKNVRII